MSTHTSQFNQPSNGDFALLTPFVILLPSPSAAYVEPYRTLFRKLHADPAFCAIAFGEDFDPIVWSDEEVKTFLLDRDTEQRWKRSGMGDFAVGVLNNRTWFEDNVGETTVSGEDVFKVITGKQFEVLKESFEGEGVEWVGYTCARNAATAGGSITDRYSHPPAGVTLPAQEDMIEVRYGMDPDHRGRGIATRAARIVMDWAVETKGARRFIAETQGKNVKSQGLLRKLGFIQSDVELGFKEETDDGVVEWVKVVGS